MMLVLDLIMQLFESQSAFESTIDLYIRSFRELEKNVYVKWII